MKSLLIATFYLMLISRDVSSYTKPNLVSKQPLSDTFSYWIHGQVAVPPKYYTSPFYVVNKKWGIEHIAIAGCIVTQEIIDKAQQHNEEKVQLALKTMF